MNSRARFILACAAALAIVLPLGWMWQRSLLPSSYSVADMGYMDYGGGPRPLADDMGHDMGHDMAGHGKTVSVRDLTADPKRKASQTVDLIARQGKVKLASGRVIDGYSINGKTPGPTIKVVRGALVEIHLKNANVKEGVALHWHGVDLPNAEDGVAGVTQDAVLPGESHTYRFAAPDSGTYWYHSHQLSHRQVIGGMFGALIVTAPAEDFVAPPALAIAHTYDGVRTINGREGVRRLPGPAERPVRIINTDNGTVDVWGSEPYTVTAIDGRYLYGGTPTKKRLRIPAGGRADVLPQASASGAYRLQIGAATALILGPKVASIPPRPAQPSATLDLLSYGSPTQAPSDLTDAAEAIASAKPDRTFQYSIGRRLGFLDGMPGYWWTVNGHLYPNIPMFMVREGDLVKFHIDNHSGESHPMHLHGHHALVVARDGKPVTGSPLWVDSIDVENNETMDLVFRADNPGIWMDHCHNLTHAAEGLVAHLMYEGVTTPYVVGGKAGNQPE